MKITPTLSTALAIAALIIPAAAAQAQPADMHASTAIAAAQAQHRQDLRSPDARDAAVHPRGPGHAINAPGATAVDSATTPGVVTTAPAVQAPSDGGIDWTTVLVGIAGALIAVGGIALVVNHRNTPRLGASV